MQSNFSKRARKILLSIVLLSALFYFSNSLRGVLRSALVPLVGATRSVASQISGVWDKYLNLVGIAEKNLKLENEVQVLQGQVAQLRESLFQLGQETFPVTEPATLARILSQDPYTMVRSVIIDRGTRHGVQVGNVAVYQDQLVGRVIRSDASSAQVLLITDPRLQISVFAQNSRAKGVLRGQQKNLSLNRDLWLTHGEYFDRRPEIIPGELLMTSGLDGLFPAGIPVGRVRKVLDDRSGLFQSAEVEPLVEPHKLEKVWIRSYGS